MTVEIIDYIKEAIKFRLIKASGSDEEIDFPVFDFAADESEFSKFVTENNFQIFEILILLLSILPHVPTLLPMTESETIKPPKCESGEAFPSADDDR